MPTVNAFNNELTTARRQRVMLEGLGRYAETYPYVCATSVAIQGSGTVYYSPIGLLAGDVVTSLQVGIGTGGSSFSGIGSRVGLYLANGASGTLVASSGDISATVSATGMKTLPLTLQSNGQPFVVPSDAAYYCAWISVATTPPTPSRAAGGSANALGVITSALAGIGGAQVGQTDLPATATIAFNSQSFYWFGVA